MATFPVSYNSVYEFLAGYKSVPDGTGGSNATMIAVHDWLDDFFTQQADVAAAVTYILEHGNDPYLQYFVSGTDLGGMSIENFNNLVPAEYDGVAKQTMIVMGDAAMDAAHFRAIIDNRVYFAQQCTISVTDTAANIASMQQHLLEMQAKDFMLGANAVLSTHVVDTSSALRTLTLGAIRDLVDGGMTHVDVTDDRLEMSLAQYRALADITFAEEDRHVVFGTDSDDVCVAGDQWTGLHGARGDDRLELGSGGGELWGGRGHDILAGGDGTDEFIFARPGQSTAGIEEADLIRNFGEGDVVRLAFLDGLNGHPAPHWIGEGEFSSSAGEVRLVKDDGRVTVEVDADGDGAADMSILFHGQPELTAADFVA
jgi:Ca2+-binding RTX toxin-like protein